MAYEYVKITHDLDRRMAEYSTTLDLIAVMLGDGAKQTIRGSAQRFAVTAAKWTPPDAGKAKISKDKLSRTGNIKSLNDPNFWQDVQTIRYFRVKKYHDETPWGIKDYATGRWRWYKTYDEAKANNLIPTRGAVRYGWLQALPVLGVTPKLPVPASFKYAKLAPKFLAQGKIGRTTVEETPDRLVITIENNSCVPSGRQSEYVTEYAAAKALSLVNLGLKHQLKRLVKDMEEAPF